LQKIKHPAFDHKSIKIYLKWIGRALVLLSLIFVSKKFWQYKTEVTQLNDSNTLWLFVLLFFLLYGLLKFIHALGWFYLLHIGKKQNKPIQLIEAVIVFGKTHIAKYIPGNIFHYTGRHIFARGYNLSDSYLIKTTFVEITIVISIAILFSLFSINGIIEGLPYYLPFLNKSMILIVISGMIFILFIIIYFWIDKIVGYLRELNFIQFFKTYLLYLLFFSINIVFFFSVIYVVDPELMLNRYDIFKIIGGYSAAWVIGFLVPGAPGGIGVREAVLITLLGPVLQESTLVIVTVLFRIVTLAGDFVHFLLTILIEYLTKKLNYKYNRSNI